MVIGADLVQKTIDAVIDGSADATPQEELFENAAELRPAPKIFRETCEIDWTKPAKEIHNHIRGLAPYPAAWTLFEVGGKMVNFKIYESEIISESHDLAQGTIVTDNKTTLRIAVQDGFIDILELQMSGKRKMKTRELLNGFSFD